MSDMYDWDHCDHRGIGNIGCPTCDPDKGRVLIRQQRLDNRDLRAQLAATEALLAATQEQHARAAESAYATLEAARLLRDVANERADKAEAEAVRLRAALETSVSHCRLNCTPESYCGQCEPLLAALRGEP